MWPPSQPDPSILAAYNAALESLRSRPPFPSFSASPSASGTFQTGETLPYTAGGPSCLANYCLHESNYSSLSFALSLHFACFAEAKGGEGER